MAQVIESKRKKGTVKLVIGALIFGVAAAGFTYLYLRIKEHDLREALRERDTKKVPVVVAKQDLPQGAPVNSDTMAVRRIPAELAYPDVVTPNTFDSVENNFLSKPLAAGTPLLKTFLEEEVARDFSDTIPLGRRAMTIQVDEINSVGGFIRPGNRVDLYARLPAEAKGPDATDDQDRIVPLLQKVEVLATGRDAASDYQAKYIEVSGGNRNAFTYTTLTVNVSPEQAALLATGRDKGDLVALLRNRDDKGRALFEEITPRDIFEHSATQAGKARAQKAAASLDNARKLQKGDLVVKDGVVTTADGKPVDNLVAHPDGTVTTKDGRLVMNADGTMAEGAMVTPDGKVVANPNLRVKDGTVMTKDGVVLSGRGLRVNGDGELVDEDGRVVDPESLKATKNGQIITADGEVLEDTSTVVTADGKSLAPGDVHVTRDGFLATKDGTVMTSDGTVLKGAKLTDDGRVVAADGTVLTPDTIQTNGDGTVTRRTEETVAGVQAEKAMDADEVQRQLAEGTLKETKDGFVVTEDGTVMTKDGNVLHGAQVNEDGQVVAEDGTVLHPDGLTIGPDGEVRKVTQQEVAGVEAQANGDQTRAMTKVVADGLTERDDGLLVAADGTVMTEDGETLDGVTVGEDGTLRTADGTVVDGRDLVVHDDGSVTTRDGRPLDGVTADTSSPRARHMRDILQAHREAEAASLGATFELIIGGSSKNGVPTVTEVQVQE